MLDHQKGERKAAIMTPTVMP